MSIKSIATRLKATAGGDPDLVKTVEKGIKEAGEQADLLIKAVTDLAECIRDLGMDADEEHNNQTISDRCEKQADALEKLEDTVKVIKSNIGSFSRSAIKHYQNLK